MKALIYKGPKKVELQERPTPVCGPDDVLVRNVRAGICGSDVTAYLYDGKYVGILPDLEFGHEMVGYVYEVGKNVTCVEKGTRVFVNPMTCTPDPSASDRAGAFSQFVLVQYARLNDNIYPLPDALSFDDAVLIEPFSVGTHGKNIPQTKPENHVVIYGAGTIGLCALSGLIAQGNKKVAVLDMDDRRLQTVRELGGIGFNPKSGDVRNFLIGQFGEITKSHGSSAINIDVAIDCAGAPNIPEDFLNYAKLGAKLSCVALHKKSLLINFMQIMSSEAVIMGSRGYTSEDILEVINNLTSKKVNITKIITHRFKLTDAAKAFEIASNQSLAIKVVLDLE
ncbi:alcohol dehydrogenase catalytic domain-containing protein|uniref:2-desacetyl-2-hydroxyethyl bacteriochlorophyllide A dehydrogenase n=1 Tax=Dendrosporobacter quercicolus TaxID=146817 RepID=A0A1G9NCT1_9FIRM|nr:alcohol dehydrogenase catalytic domain-containing protein [Dendrosporobacter quercicolus]NSL47294.1 alcohol dehydrogenase catalytic domain-containing protein [Dendrosporobacter quercicolus DSM 1736]SDL84131.1 2-desacetyl-2-hydroxyethyl bacteriochlorophyllide A dehydrogenase [Dendrosporobacter quercicolus]